MNAYWLKRILGFSCLMMMLVPPLFAQKGKGGSGTGCVDITTPTFSASSATPGTGIGVFSRVGNCAAGKQRYTITISSVSSCAQETVISAGVIAFDAGQYKLISSPYQIAPDTCTGTSVVSVKVESGGTLLGMQSSNLTIQ